MVGRQQITCTYNRRPRELCPVILGHKKGEEIALAYQFAGLNTQGSPVTGGWRCLRLANVPDPKPGEGLWHAGSSHRRQQSCVDDVDIDVNPRSPYRPKRPMKSRA
ncbi:MAG: hypothetical protein QOF41_1925 [Methylobacteriaceae bacterium]|jgi:hypothetical protein|nr:hypothetical protein [Methylobacteriaceae bacterium]